MMYGCGGGGSGAVGGGVGGIMMLSGRFVKDIDISIEACF